MSCLEEKMKKIYNQDTINTAICDCIYAGILQSLSVPLFLIEYEAGENISSPFHGNSYLQIVITGTLSIYFIREDGSTYSLSTGGKGYIIGDMELFTDHDNSVLAEATDKLLVLALNTTIYKKELLHNIPFMQLIASNMAKKIVSIMNQDAIYSSLSDRVLNYMYYRCPDMTLCGIEKTAFKLHCSSRQLQRILNTLENKDIITKLGKGTYKIKSLPILK